MYDLAPETAAAFLAIGTTDASGAFTRYAYEAPFVRFASKDVFKDVFAAAADPTTCAAYGHRCVDQPCCKGLNCQHWRTEALCFK